jgi:hypothetical protein
VLPLVPTHPHTRTDAQAHTHVRKHEPLTWAEERGDVGGSFLQMAKTQKNKATSGHLGLLKARLAKLRRELLTPSKSGGGGGDGAAPARGRPWVPVALTRGWGWAHQDSTWPRRASRALGLSVRVGLPDAPPPPLCRRRHCEKGP